MSESPGVVALHQWRSGSRLVGEILTVTNGGHAEVSKFPVAMVSDLRWNSQSTLAVVAMSCGRSKFMTSCPRSKLRRGGLRRGEDDCILTSASPNADNIYVCAQGLTGTRHGTHREERLRNEGTILRIREGVPEKTTIRSFDGEIVRQFPRPICRTTSAQEPATVMTLSGFDGASYTKHALGMIAWDKEFPSTYGPRFY